MLPKAQPLRNAFAFYCKLTDSLVSEVRVTSMINRFMACPACLTVTTVRAIIACPACASSRPGILLQNTDGLTLVDMTRLEQSRKSRHAESDKHQSRWLFDFVRRVRALSENEVRHLALDMVSLFWIRLHIALTELPEKLRLSQDIYSSTSAEDRQAWKASAPDMYRFIATQAAAASALQDIARALTDDEHIYADWRRQTEAHLSQTAYGLQMQGKIGSTRWVKESSRIASLARAVSIDERDAARARVLQAHSNDDTTVAKAFAAKLAGAAEQLHAAWSVIENEWDVR